MRTVCRQNNIVKSNENYCQAGEEFDAFTNSCVDPADGNYGFHAWMNTEGMDNYSPLPMDDIKT